MPRFQQAIHNEFQALELVRDELQLQAHLFRSEAATRWQEMEVSWSDLKEHLQRARVAATSKDPEEVEAAARLRVDAVKKGYADFKKALTH